jgi:hypothetical protein
MGNEGGVRVLDFELDAAVVRESSTDTTPSSSVPNSPEKPRHPS